MPNFIEAAEDFAKALEVFKSGEHRTSESAAEQALTAVYDAMVFVSGLLPTKDDTVKTSNETVQNGNES